jgi:hypothetical protein
MKTLFQRALIVLLGGYFIYGGLSPDSCGIVNSADLALHEGGHVFFGIFGEYIGMWGGTLMQLAMPLAIAIHFFTRGEDFSARVVLTWFGQNFFHIARYIKDAQAQALPLVGGGVHDWHYILDRAGLLTIDKVIGNFVWAAGLLIILYAVSTEILSSRRSKEELSA